MHPREGHDFRGLHKNMNRMFPLMPFGQFTGILDDEPFNLLCTVDIDVNSSKIASPSSMTDLLLYHLIQATWL